MRKVKKYKSFAIFAMAAGFSAASSAADDGAAKFDFDHVSCTGGDHEIRVVIEGVKKSVGLMSVDLYADDRKTFLKRAGRLHRIRVAAKSPRTNVCIKAPGSGVFAVTTYHDENANRDFDKGALGIPVEPWGVSNNPKIRFGPPKVDAALFPVDTEGAKVSIKLN